MTELNQRLNFTHSRSMTWLYANEVVGATSTPSFSSGKTTDWKGLGMGMCTEGWVKGSLWSGNLQMLGPMVRSDSHFRSQDSSRLIKREGLWRPWGVQHTYAPQTQSSICCSVSRHYYSVPDSAWPAKRATDVPCTVGLSQQSASMVHSHLKARHSWSTRLLAPRLPSY